MFVRSVSYKEKERILISALAKARHLECAQEFSGSSVTPFVGRFGYPKVDVGIMAPPIRDEQAKRFDAPREWAQNNATIAQVVDFRSQMINSRFVSDVKSPDKLVELAQDVAMSKSTIDIDVLLEKKPKVNITTDQWVAPMGAQARLKRLALSSNPDIPTRVQKYFDDTDVRAVEALTELYDRDLDENALSRMLSVGVFGKQRKLVPTRWSITAVDDTVGKHVLEQVRDLAVGDCRAYFGGYLGNYYLILCFPEEWRYELFEMYVNPDRLDYSTDYEPFEGRKEYSRACAGGYYTVRLAAAEKCVAEKRQFGVLALRFITDEYVLPLGVWVTREATRKALSSKPIGFADKDLLLKYAKALAKKKFGVDLNPLLERSNLLKERQTFLDGW
ncbi:hypothetical protein J4219_01530 [Candidatus Woesearchaeota archaeon]|nr:hypothetical protein [Candidatus Woesearchaeota archaeon]